MTWARHQYAELLNYIELVDVYQAFMETAWRFPGHRHNLGTSIGGAVVDQRHLGHNNGSLTLPTLDSQLSDGRDVSRNMS